MSALPSYAESVDPRREASLRFVSDVLAVLGHPIAWAEQLEQQCFDAGRVWRHRDDLPPALPD
jgi:hypothetical protein